MKVCVLLLLVAFTAAKEIHDGEIFDKFNIIEIIRNNAAMKKVFDCVMDRGPCGEYQVIRDRGASLLNTRCEDCTPEQKAKFEDVITEFEKDHNEEYKELMAKFVPTFAA